MSFRFSQLQFITEGRLGLKTLDVVRMFCAGAVLLGSIGVADAAAFVDVNCNGIAAANEFDRARLPMQRKCIDYVKNDNTCMQLGEFPPTIDCDRYVVTPGLEKQEATCSPVYASDKDADGLGDGCDNCPLVANADQKDTDHDGLGDACDSAPNVPTEPDSDKDGVSDARDNCRNVANADQTDSDKDGVGNVCDNCPQLANANQADSDNDGIGDACAAVMVECSGGCSAVARSGIGALPLANSLTLAGAAAMFALLMRGRRRAR